MSDPDTTEPIAALRASFGEPTRSPWGPDDQIGMLNLISGPSRARVLAEADPTTCFDLSVEMFVGMPSWTYKGDPPYSIWMSHTPGGDVVDDARRRGDPSPLLAYSGDCISMYTHCGTHIDALNHFGYHGKIWNGFTAAQHLGSRQWHVCGADRCPAIVARGVLIDVAAAHRVDVLPDSYGIGEDDLRAALARQGTTVERGDVVLIRTGRMQRWPEPDPYMLDEPGLNREGAEFLAMAGAILIGADNVGMDQMPSIDERDWAPVHTYLLAEAGVPILEVANLEEVSAARLYEFAFFGAPIKLRGATAAPLRPIAMPLRRV
jgi:kynurenine formamidase